jgi:beta-lactam-binding protein with PASTA domain
MKRTISSVLALAMVAALLAIFAGAASAEVTEPSGQIAVINGASADPVTAGANGTQIGGDLAYAGDAQAAIFPAGSYDVAFSDTSQTSVTLVGTDAFTVVSGFGASGATAYVVEVAPFADTTQGKIQLWNATTADVTVDVGFGDITVAPGESMGPNAVAMAPGTYPITIDGSSQDITIGGDSYTDVFAVSDGTATGIALAVIGSMTDLITALTPTAPPAGIAVPDVVGQTEADANVAITDVGLVVAKTEAADDTVPAGNVISQDPVGGTEVPDGSTVNIVVSTGPDTPTNVPVPDVSGKTAADAQAELEAAGFTVVAEEQSSMDVEAGLVIETNPSAGTEVAPGTEVKMIVSSGAGDVVVPDFTGMTQDEATKAADDAGLTISFVEDADDPDPDGVIVSQDPTGGTNVEAGSEVIAQLSPAVDDPWVILTLSPERVLTASGINFQPGSTVDLVVLETDKDAKATVQDDGSWAATADLSDVQNEAELLLVTGTAADGSAYESTFKIPAAGETVDEPTESVPVEEEDSGVPVWVWIVLGLLVIAIVALGIKMFGGGDSTGGDDTTGGDAPTTQTS